MTTDDSDQREQAVRRLMYLMDQAEANDWPWTGIATEAKARRIIKTLREARLLSAARVSPTAEGITDGR